MSSGRKQRPTAEASVFQPETRRLAAAFVCVLTLLFSFTTSFAGAWKSKVIDKNGVPHVMNPVKPAEEPTEIAMKELFRLGGDTDNDEEFFGLISRIMMDERGQVYVLDSQLHEIKIYSNDGEFLNSIGREGEGPGEFRRPGDMFFTPDGNIGVMQTVPGKIVLLSPDGEPAGDHPLPETEGGGFQILQGGQQAGPNLALVRRLQNFDQASGKIDMTFQIDIVSPAGEVLATTEQKDVNLTFANMIIKETEFDTFERRWAAGSDGRVYACPTRSEYVINVYAADGSLERVIQREYESYERTQEQIDRVKSIYEAFTRQAPGATAEASKEDKDIQTIYVREDGSIWALTAHGARKQPDGAIGVFDVFDADGRFVRQITLKGQGNPQEDAYFFSGDRLYVVTGFLNAVIAQQGGTDDADADADEDVTPMEIICYQLDAPVIAKGK